MKRESPRLAPQRPIGGFRLPTVPDIGGFRVGPRDACPGTMDLSRYTCRYTAGTVHLPLYRAIGVSHIRQRLRKRPT